MSTKVQDSLKDIVSLCKRRGFIFPGSEIYDGLANTWDYAPYGVELKKNIKDLWWKKFVTNRTDVVGLDSSILLNPKVWEASGHVGNFSDPLMDCKECKERVRGDHLIEKHLGEDAAAGKSFDEIAEIISSNNLPCPSCGKTNFTEPRAFNLMFKTSIGVVEDSEKSVYLRPETAQGIFINFKTIAENCRQKIPFGVGQIGKSFRNEITPGNFIFRTREFEQMEMEFFCKPGSELEWYAFWKEYCMNWLVEDLGINKDKLKFRDHGEKELSFYSNATSDIEYEYPFGWGELWGIASRTDYDLKQHQEHSKKDLRYHDKVTNDRYVPYVIEPALGADRLLLTVLVDAYEVEELENDTRTVLRFHPSLAPVKIAVLPLSKKPELQEPSQKIYQSLIKKWNVEYDETQAIGKRYRRQDEIGTPFCVTVDFDTLEDNAVTVRERDSMKQERISIDQLKKYFTDKLDGVDE